MLENKFPKNFALIALAETNNKPTAPLIQMRMGKKKVNKLFSSLGGSVGLKMVIQRSRGYSDNL